AYLAQLEQPIQLGPAKGRFLAAALNLDVLASAGHDQVQIHVGILVLDISQIEQGHLVEEANADRRHAAPHNAGGRTKDVLVGGQGIDQGDVSSVNGRGPRASVGFQDIAVN